MLKLENTRIVQGDFTMDADFELVEGRKYAVIGPSGAGKSTLLNSLCGFLPLARGRLLCNSADLSQAAPGARPITMLFQDNNLFPHLTAAQNVGLGIKPALHLSE
ncbi:MAG: ATP-binding cassette domain-containing protein, partial [Pseudomonadota bacterium]